MTAERRDDVEAKGAEADETRARQERREMIVAAVEGGISSVPVVGGVVGALFGHLVRRPLERRRQEWEDSVERGLLDLASRIEGFRVEQLQDREDFVSTAVTASLIAYRTHSRKKLDALRNAILNSVPPSAPSESEREMFLSIIDRMTDWHIENLRFLNEPRAWAIKSGVTFPSDEDHGSLAEVYTTIHPSMKGAHGFYTVILKDLDGWGLSASHPFHARMVGSTLKRRRSSIFGRRFLKFIRDPLSESR